MSKRSATAPTILPLIPVSGNAVVISKPVITPIVITSIPRPTREATIAPIIITAIIIPTRIPIITTVRSRVG